MSERKAMDVPGDLTAALKRIDELEMQAANLERERDEARAEAARLFEYPSIAFNERKSLPARCPWIKPAIRPDPTPEGAPSRASLEPSS